MAKVSHLEERLRRLTSKGLELERVVCQVESEVLSKCQRLRGLIKKMQDVSAEANAIHFTLSQEEDSDKDKEIAELKAKLEQYEARIVPEAEDPTLTQASTIAIFDSILFAIENWSTDADTAPDFSLACQAVLFPLVYNQVMNGNEHYYLRKVPAASLEVVKRGREYVKFIRDTCPVGLTDPTAWGHHIDMISKWWVNDALPLLYGARDPVWEKSSTLSLEAIMSWRDKPASRALDFPLVFDAMDLLDRHREAIREKTNLPDFTRDTLNTRLEAN